MKQRKIGEKVIVRGMTATVASKPARESGMQLITFDGIYTFLSGVEWHDWRKLAEMPTAPTQATTEQGKG